MANTKEWKWGYITPQGEFAIHPAFDGASDFRENLAAVKVNWARGYIDRTGHFAINPVFEAAGDFHDGRAIVRLDGTDRLIDRNGGLLDAAVPAPLPQFESGYDPHYDFHDGLVRFVENQKYGYKDSAGRVVIKAQYFDAGDFSDGLACVRKGKSSPWGYIDTSGRLAIPARFRQARAFNQGLAAVLVDTATER